ncbi:MAG: hypothetical protein ABJG78_19145 [Cyclobacteriaceae bacterium]
MTLRSLLGNTRSTNIMESTDVEPDIVNEDLADSIGPVSLDREEFSILKKVQNI